MFKLHVSLADDPKVKGFLADHISAVGDTTADAFNNAVQSAAYIKACHDLGSSAVILYNDAQVKYVIPKERAVRSVFITSLVQA